MTLFDTILINLIGMWPIIIPVSLVLCVLIYSMTRSIGWVAFIVVLTLILLIPSLVYLCIWLGNQ